MGASSRNTTICAMSYEQEEEDHYVPGYEVGSYTKDYSDGPYDGENDLTINANPEGKPRILLMGLRRSGKSSIQISGLKFLSIKLMDCQMITRLKLKETFTSGQ